MSLNLHCNQIKLRQTPQYVTCMCMVQVDGAILDEAEGNRARLALQIYLQWLTATLNMEYEKIGDYHRLSSLLDRECRKVEKVIKSKKKLKVWIV